MSIIKQLIAEEVSRILAEQEEPVVEPDTSTEGDLDLGGDDSGGDLDLGGDEDLGGDLDLGGGDAGGIGGGDSGLDLGGEEGDLSGEDGLDGGFGGGGGGGFSGGGGGFDFGDDGDAGIDPDEEGEEDLATTVGPEDVEMPSDPIMAVTDEAISLLNQTRKPAVILKTVKSSIQKYFSSFEESTPIIKALWDTGDITLQDVAKRLLLFIKGI